MSENEQDVKVERSRGYIYVWLCLVALTGATVAVSRMRLTGYAVLAAMAIATLKAGLVTGFFMHIKDEPWIIRSMLIVVLLALGLIIGLTFSDVSFRHG